MNRYTLRLRARTGMVVENLMVHARDRAEAERKIEQVYRNCEILECREIQTAAAGEGLDFESVLSLINREKGGR